MPTTKNSTANTNGYAPLNETRRTLRVKWYRSPIEPAALRRLMRRSDLRGAFQAVGHLALAAATGALTYYLFTRQLWAAFALAFLFHGGVTSFFSFACHELVHGTVFRTKPLNRLFLRVYAFLAWFNYHDYALSHTYHHRYTLHPEGDREVVLPKTPSLRVLYLLQLCTFSVTGGFESNGLTTFVYWRMNWHLEHHMYAGVPCYNLRRLRRAIAADLPPARTLFGAWREMRAIWKRQQTEPDYQYDTPVPAPARAAAPGGRNDDDLGASIGDLAPGILARAGA